MNSSTAASSSQLKLTRLRQATAQAHRRVEEAVDLLVPTERAGYARYLGRLLGFYEPFERMLEELLGKLSGLGLVTCPEMRRRAALLQRDLTWLDVDTRVLPRCDELPRLSTPVCALGALYVVEGATLGARVQLRRLRDSLGVSPTAGAVFLGSDGDDVETRWRATCAVIGAVEDTAMRELLDGASATFEAFDRWLRLP